jgi:ABC-type Fe3+-siderophore transport system permease subunit
MKKQLRPYFIVMAVIVGVSILARFLSDSGVITYTMDLVISLVVPLVITAYFVYIAWKESKEDKKNGL